MPLDFKARQIRTAQIIASGSVGTPLAVYGSGSALDFDGSFPASLLTNVGSDTFLFVSGGIGKKGLSNTTAVSVFGGDVVISGTIFNGAGSAYSIGGSGGDIYWESTAPGVIFATGSANASFLSASSGLQVTGSINLTGSITHSGSFKVFSPDEGTINLFSSAGDSSLSHVSDGNLYLTNNRPGGEIVLGATNLGNAGKQLLRLEASNATGNLFLSGSVYLGINSSDSLYVNAKLASDIIPDGDRTRNLGSDSFRFANIFTGDLHLRNDRGNWTIIEEESYLSVVNNLTGKRYKMMLEPLD